jgi:hypothetical protein
VADFNSDGYADVAVAGSTGSGSAVEVLLRINPAKKK